MNIGEAFIRWASQQASIKVLLLIGSRARSEGEPGSADIGSDWDFQVVTSDPSLFGTDRWCLSAGISQPLVYSNRAGRLGHTPKVSAIFPNGELDIVIIPESLLFIVLLLNRCSLINLVPKAKRAIFDLSSVLQGGYRFMKGTIRWKSFFNDVSRLDTSKNLTDRAILDLWHSFLCDYRSVIAKIERGELSAAQRWLHLNLAEVNFVLFHELRRRLNLPSFPDARRIETLASDDWLERVSIDCRLERRSLNAAANKSFQTCRMLVMSLGAFVTCADFVRANSSSIDLGVKARRSNEHDLAIDQYH